jgi:hypothetical protein
MCRGFIEYVNPFVLKLNAWGTLKRPEFKRPMLLVTLVEFGSLICTLLVDCGKCSAQKGQLNIAHCTAVIPR